MSKILRRKVEREKQMQQKQVSRRRKKEKVQAQNKEEREREVENHPEGTHRDKREGQMLSFRD